MSLEVNVSKRLRDYTLDLSFSCGDNELFAIIGPSGAGKTTLIRILAGLETAESGFVSSSGTVWVDTCAGICLPSRKRGIGYVFQEFTLFPNLSVYGNVMFAAKSKKRGEDLMKQLDIWKIRNSMTGMISGGERQRCAICQALAREPEVLLMDEPFSALDAVTRRKLREMMRAIKRELKIPVLHVTHDIYEAKMLGDNILPVVSGRIEERWMLQFLFNSRDSFFCANSGVIINKNENSIYDNPLELTI